MYDQFIKDSYASLSKCTFGVYSFFGHFRHLDKVQSTTSDTEQELYHALCITNLPTMKPKVKLCKGNLQVNCGVKVHGKDRSTGSGL